MQGVFSHETALSLHGLSDVLPVAADMTLPADWRRRRLKAPEGLVLHFADVPEGQRTSFGPVPLTLVLRTLNDCAEAHVEDLWLAQGVREALARGPLGREEVALLHPASRCSCPSPAKEPSP